MPNLIEVQTAIETRLKEQWPLVWNRTEKVVLVYEAVGNEEPKPPYIKFYIKHDYSREQGYGSNQILYRRFGTIIAICITDKGIAMTLSRRMANAIGQIFEGQKFSGVTCREFEPNELGINPEGDCQTNARVVFDYDEIKDINA